MWKRPRLHSGGLLAGTPRDVKLVAERDVFTFSSLGTSHDVEDIRARTEHDKEMGAPRHDGKREPDERTVAAVLLKDVREASVGGSDPRKRQSVLGLREPNCVHEPHFNWNAFGGWASGKKGTAVVCGKGGWGKTNACLFIAHRFKLEVIKPELNTPQEMEGMWSSCEMCMATRKLLFLDDLDCATNEIVQIVLKLIRNRSNVKTIIAITDTPTPALRAIRTAADFVLSVPAPSQSDMLRIGGNVFPSSSEVKLSRVARASGSNIWQFMNLMRLTHGGVDVYSTHTRNILDSVFHRAPRVLHTESQHRIVELVWRNLPDKVLSAELGISQLADRLDTVSHAQHLLEAWHAGLAEEVLRGAYIGKVKTNRAYFSYNFSTQFPPRERAFEKKLFEHIEISR